MNPIAHAIDEFKKDPKQRYIIVDYTDQKYKGKRLNAYCDWYKVRNILVIYFKSIVMYFLYFWPPCNLKNWIYRTFLGIKIGKDVSIAPLVIFDPFFPEFTTIEDNVLVGSGCEIATHEFTLHKIRMGRVHIKKNCLIGGLSTIRSGVTIGENSVIALKSYIREDVAPWSFMAGTPAQLKKTLTKEEFRNI